MIESSVKLGLYTWLSNELGVRHVFRITFSEPLITGNTINASFNAEVIDPVIFTVDALTTIKALAREIQRQTNIFHVEIINSTQLLCTALVPGTTIVVTGPTVTGGASQATAVVATIVTPSSVPCIFADRTDDTGRAAPRPESYPYATIRISNISKYGQDETRFIDDDSGIANLMCQRRATITIDYFGEYPFENILKAYNSLEKTSLIALFEEYRFAYLEKNDVQNLTAVLETKYEERCSFDFYIGFTDIIEDDQGLIEEIDSSDIIYVSP